MHWPWLAGVALLILGLWANALLAVRDKSSTVDEPVHTLSSWLIVNRGDFRLSPEHPPLWKYFIGLSQIGQPLDVDLDSPAALEPLAKMDRIWAWPSDVLYRRPPPEAKTPAARLQYGETLVRRARVMNSLFLIALGCLVARWAWAWAGPVAAVVATALLTLDPNFLAHGALVTNDVALSTAMAVAAYLAWRLGQRLTWPRAIGFAAACTAAVNIKLSGALLIPMLGLPLAYRAMNAHPWPLGSGARLLKTRARKCAALAGVIVLAGGIEYAAVWTLYDFREAPTVAGQRFDDAFIHHQTKYYALRSRWLAEHDTPPPIEYLEPRIDSTDPGPLARVMAALQDRRLMPQAWMAALNNVAASSKTRDSYLLGRISYNGFRWYFPLAVLFKTPVALLLFAAAAGTVGLVLLKQRWREPEHRWEAVCILTPPLVYFALAVVSNVNIGIRHLLPAYVPVFVACGVVAARFVAARPQVRALPAVAIVALAVETLSVFPNYISFFNRPSGGAAGGLWLLSDSNLDWGQDLPALSRWYKDWRPRNPGRPFHLMYFGSVDTAAYGLPNVDVDPPGGVYAVSATLLQGFAPPQLMTTIDKLRLRRPVAVIDGTIYIYDLPQTPASNR